jgi:hypothetical protein
MDFIRRMLELAASPLRAMLSAPNRLISGSQRLRQISLPARVALLTAVFLIVCVVATLVIFAHQRDLPHWVLLKSVKFYVVVVLLVVIIPLVLYKALVLWLEGDMSPFPDIAHAWKAGLEELERQGIDLTQTPLFLVLGSADEWQEKALFDAARLSLNVREFPKGRAALHWYANPEGVYLVCSDASALGSLSRLSTEVAKESGRKADFVAESPADASIRGTIIVGKPSAREASAPPPPSPAARPAAPRAMDIRGTMILSGHDSETDGSGAVNVVEKRVVKLPQDDASLQQRRLEYVCRLVRRVRQPFCPVNGVLVLLPFALIQRSAPEAIELQRAMQRDLDSLLRVLMVRSPVTAMVIGLEDENGFRELVRRVGRERALGQRFGKGFSLANPPSGERLEALCAHACGAFEDWVYTLFREKEALSKPGNAKLYALLCKIRRNVQGRLSDILANACGYDPDKEPRDAAALFGGCYFAATGDTEDRQAFVKGVFDKLPEQQEEVEWTQLALRQDQQFHALANVGLCVGSMLLIGLVAMVVIKAIW